MAIAQTVHVLQHVALVEHGVLQAQLAKKAAIAVVSDGQVIPETHGKQWSVSAQSPPLPQLW